VALRAASISIHAPWLRHNCLRQPISFWCYWQSVKWKPVVIMGTAQCIITSYQTSQGVWRFLTPWPTLTNL